MTGPSLRQLAMAVLLLAVLGLATHGRVVDSGHAFDPLYTVRDDPHVRADTQLAKIFSSPYWDAEAFARRGLWGFFSPSLLAKASAGTVNQEFRLQPKRDGLALLTASDADDTHGEKS